MKTKKNILIAPLDWGLGHSTRCIPIIKYLQKCGHKVFIASEGISAQMLKENFPNLEILPLQGYRIQYAKSKWNFSIKILAQIPKIKASIRREHLWLDNIIEKFEIDLVISDNRYGLYSSKVKTVILTHQVQVKSGMNALIDRFLLKWHCSYLEKFQETWIVDTAKAPGLAAGLSHPKTTPNNARYISWLSQFIGFEQRDKAANNNQILILLSGPEPMRGQLEQKLWLQCLQLKSYKFVFVSGNPLNRVPQLIPENIDWYSHLNAEALAKMVQESQAVVCRSGYSSLMDLKILGRPAILIPTPGQSEQEYLAKELCQADGQFMCATQNEIKLENALAKILAINQLSDSLHTELLYTKAIDAMLKD